MLLENSSLLSSVNYINNGIEVVFKQGGTKWFYKDVPEDVYKKMINADSIGKYFLENVKSNYVAQKM